MPDPIIAKERKKKKTVTRTGLSYRVSWSPSASEAKAKTYTEFIERVMIASPEKTRGRELIPKVQAILVLGATSRKYRWV